MFGIRIATVLSTDPEEVSTYLPSNYKIVTHTDGEVIIAGEDNHGWTLDEYVIPRLASGMIHCREITDQFTLKGAS